MSLLNCEIKREYRSLIDNIPRDFYIPLLSEAKTYKRAVGFFSSSSLIHISYGIGKLALNGGHIQLIASPHLTDEDFDAIAKGYEKRHEIIENALNRELHDYLIDSESMQRLNLLANLIEDDILDIRIAFLKKEQSLGMYHEKMGIIIDSEDNKVAFSGSMNETSTAMIESYEAIDVFKSWGGTDSAERIDLKNKAFDSIWENTENGIEVRSFPNVTKKMIEKYRTGNPNYYIDSPLSNPVNSSLKTTQKVFGARIPNDIQLFDYQKEAIDNWEANNYRGIFDMATGTGKTLTGLGAIARLSEKLDDELAVIIVCPYQHLVEQWVEDIKKFNINPIIGYSASPMKDWKARLAEAIRNQKIISEKRFFCFICTNATFTSKYVQDEIKKIKKQIVLVIDEAHNFGARTYAPLLTEQYTYRLALSATLDRHGDKEGTNALYDFFGNKCIEYSLDRAIDEGKLTPYNYYPVLVYLNPNELTAYSDISLQMSRHMKKEKSGKLVLDKTGELLAIKRSRIIAAASDKLIKLSEIIEPYKNDNFLLVYCGATNVIKPDSDRSETDDESIRQIEAVTRMLGNDYGMKVAKFTSEEKIDERKSITEHFKNGDDLQGIVAIKCLDEGVNIPGIRTAFILASTTNPKEYIQRRGRVLRKAEGKEHAEIYDFITLPRPLDEVSGLTAEQMNRELSLVKNELTRIYEFGRMARNHIQVMRTYWEICDAYGLSYDFFAGGNNTDGINRN